MFKSIVAMGMMMLLQATVYSPTAFSAEKGGNGGFVVTVEDKTYVLDLYEANIHTAHVHPEFPDALMITQPMLDQIPNLDAETADYFSNRLNSLNPVSLTLSRRLKAILLSYDWRITPRRLIPALDIGQTPYDTTGLNLSRVAFRDDQMKIVWLSLEDWKALDPRNRSALILHELIYALSVEAHPTQTSEYVRLAVSLIYGPGMEKMKLETIQERLQKYIGLTKLGDTGTGLSCQEIASKSLESFERLGVLFSSSIIDHGPLKDVRGHKACKGSAAHAQVSTMDQFLRCYGEHVHFGVWWENLMLTGDVLPHKAEILAAHYPDRDETIEAEVRSLYDSGKMLSEQDMIGNCFYWKTTIGILKPYLEN